MTISSLPLHVVQGLSETEVNLVNHWWNHLAEAERVGLLAQWNARKDTYANAPCAEDNKNEMKPWISMQVYDGFFDGEFVDAKEEELPGDLYEYLVNHEIYLMDIKLSFRISA